MTTSTHPADHVTRVSPDQEHAVVYAAAAIAEALDMAHPEAFRMLAAVYQRAATSQDAIKTHRQYFISAALLCRRLALIIEQERPA